MDKKTVGARLANVRKSFGLTQVDMAERLNLGSASRLANYEQGAHWPTFELIERLEEVFDVDPTLILKGSLELDAEVQEGTRQLPGHLSLARLRGFDKLSGPQTVIFPEDVVRRRMPKADIETIRWVFNPTEAMEPRYAEGAIAFVDPRINSTEQIVSGHVYAFHIYGRPDVRRIFILGDNHLLLTGDSEKDWRLEVSGSDYKKLKIYGRVIDAI